ncbi:low-density lipoprotein receptor domain containing lost and found isoform 1-T6 [Glossina fuscipes fuscipes]
MLRPTSCGPGPPSQDTVHEFSINFKNNKTNEKPIQYQQQYQQQEQQQQQQQQQQQRQQSTPTTIQAKQPKNINKCRKNNNNNNNNKKSKRNGKFSLKSLEYSSQLLKTMVANYSNTMCNIKKTILKIERLMCTTTATSTAAAAAAAAARKWHLMFLILSALLIQTPYQAAAEKSKHYYMQSLCKNHFLQQLYRKIDGAVLWSQNERNLDCIITFQTYSILQRFMLRFDMLQLDCNDHLYVYDGEHAVATPKIDISCRQTKQTVSSMLTRTNFVTLKYVTDNWGTDANGFKLVITSVKDPRHTCKDFTCSTNGFCIHPDLLCDGINHCSDNSDESVHNLCQNETTNTVFGMDVTWFVLIVVSLLLILSAIIVGISICVCRRQEDNTTNQNTAIQLHHTAETNGSSKHLHYTHGGTLTRDHTQLPPTSGNWHHPAGPYGYHRILHNYLKMATKVRPIWCLANSVN